MADMMTFPETVEEFMEQYKFTDSKQIYTNGAELVEVYRMEQWFEHRADRMKLVQEAVDTLMNTSKTDSIKDKCFRNAARFVQNAIDGEPQDFERIPDEPEITLEIAIDYLHKIGWIQEHDRILTIDRDIPKKPNETTDTAWGIPHRQAVCPNCDYYLGQVHFICEGNKRKVTYCETCGQAIDWEGWDWDE